MQDKASSPVGQNVGNYEILRELGRGGMGVVYKAHETSLNRMVALKVLPAHLAVDEQFLGRFNREARAVAALNHPNIVTVYAVGEDRGTHFIAMEYVKGVTVAQMMRQSGPLHPDRALQIILDAAEALDLAHKRGIVHRDIKPQNVMIDEAGRVKVMDFGLARAVASESNLTADGALLGTPMYMSPEQCEGRPADHRSDIYSLGVVLYEMLTGTSPFTANTPLAIMRQIVDRPFPDIRQTSTMVPDSVAAIVNKMVAREPGQRYQSSAALCSDIRALKKSAAGNPSLLSETTRLAGISPLGSVSSVETQLERTHLIPQSGVNVASAATPAASRRSPAAMIAAVVAIVSAAAAAAFYVGGTRSAQTPDGGATATATPQDDAIAVAAVTPAPEADDPAAALARAEAEVARLRVQAEAAAKASAEADAANKAAEEESARIAAAEEDARARAEAMAVQTAEAAKNAEMDAAQMAELEKQKKEAEDALRRAEEESAARKRVEAELAQLKAEQQDAQHAAEVAKAAQAAAEQRAEEAQAAEAAARAKAESDLAAKQEADRIAAEAAEKQEAEQMAAAAVPAQVEDPPTAAEPAGISGRWTWVGSKSNTDFQLTQQGSAVTSTLKPPSGAKGYRESFTFSGGRFTGQSNDERPVGQNKGKSGQDTAKFTTSYDLRLNADGTELSGTRSESTSAGRSGDTESVVWRRISN